MNLKEIHRNAVYDEFGNKEYEGYILFFVFMSPTIAIFLVGLIIYFNI